MDIVDINKVLDDLELNEEQHSKPSKAPAHNDNAVGKPQNLYSSYKYPPSGVTSTAAVPPISTRLPKTNYVKVSNVFSR